MFCLNCGNEINDNDKVCHYCGKETSVQLEEEIAKEENKEVVKTYSNDSYDKTTKGMAAGSLLMPPFGIAYYFMSKKDFPNKAHGALEASIFGLVTYTIAALIFVFLVLPIEKNYILKYECEKSVPGSVYTYSTHTCKRPDGSEYQKFF